MMFSRVLSFPVDAEEGSKKAGAKNSLGSCFGLMLIFAKLAGQAERWGMKRTFGQRSLFLGIIRDTGGRRRVQGGSYPGGGSFCGIPHGPVR
jgi:hypothetical protein